MEAKHHYDAMVIGVGPAGLSAGIYLSRARRRGICFYRMDGTIAALAASEYINEKFQSLT